MSRAFRNLPGYTVKSQLASMPSQKGAGNVSGRMRSSPKPKPTPRPTPITLETIRDALPPDVLSKIAAISKKQAKLAENPINNPDLADFGAALKRETDKPSFLAHWRFDFAADFTLPPSKKYSASVYLFTDGRSYNYRVRVYRKSRIGLSPKLIGIYKKQHYTPAEVLLDAKISDAEERAFYSVCAHVAKSLSDNKAHAMPSPTEVDYVRFDSDYDVKETVRSEPLKTRVAEMYSTPKSAQYIRERSAKREARSGL